jgi:Fic family protein
MGWISRYLTGRKEEVVVGIEDYTVNYKTLRYKYNEEYSKILGGRVKRLDVIDELKAQNGRPLCFQKVSHVKEKLKNIYTLLEKSDITKHVKIIPIYEGLSSCVIEGAKTTVADTVRVLRGQKQIETKSERMVYNTISALNAFEDIAVRDEITLLSLWQMIVDGVCENESVRGEKYRSGGVIVGEYTPPAFTEVQTYMDALFRYIRLNEMDVLLKAITVHYYLVYIHPFCDGNGRLARFMLGNMLANNDKTKKMKYVSTSSGVMKNREGYYKSLRWAESNNLNDFTFFILYYLDIIEVQLLKSVELFGANADIVLNDRQLDIIKRIKKAGIHAMKYAAVYDIKYEQALKDLIELEDQGIFVSDYADGTRVYRSNI